MIEVYRNLRKCCWSVRDAKTRRVIEHRRRLFLEDAEFHVSPAGRERVRREGRKNVHAFVRGERVRGVVVGAPSNWGFRVTYDPYLHEGFVLADSPVSRVKRASLVEFTEHGQVWVAGKVLTLT